MTHHNDELKACRKALENVMADQLNSISSQMRRVSAMRFQEGDKAVLAVAGGNDTYDHVRELVRVEAQGKFQQGVCFMAPQGVQVPPKDGEYIVRLKNRVAVVVHDWQLTHPEYVAAKEPAAMISRSYYEAHKPATDTE